MRNQIIWSAPSKPDPSRSNEKWLIDTVNADPNVGNRWLGNQLGASKAAVNIRICSLRKAGVITVCRDPGFHRRQRHGTAKEMVESAAGPERMDAPTAGATVRAAVDLSDGDLATKIHGQLKRKDGRQHTIGRLADQFNVPPKRIRTAIQVLNDGCYMTRTVQDVVFLSDEPVGNSWSKVDSNVFFHKEIVFGALSDTHLCNKQERLEVLHGIYDIFERQGVRVVYHAGNYVDGEARFNKQELLVHGMGNQIKYFVANYPKRDGITTYYVAGDDHEGWWQQREGIEIGRYTQLEAEAAGRFDLKYLGYMEHDVVIQGEEGRAILRVVHPGGGCFDDKAEILTRHKGWVPFAHLTLEDEVATMTKSGHEFQWQQPTHITNEPYSGDLLHFRNRVFDFRVTPNHRLWTRRYKTHRSAMAEKQYPQKGHYLHSPDWQAVTAEEIEADYQRQRFALPTACSDWRGDFTPVVEVPRREPVNPGNRRNVAQMQHVGTQSVYDMAELMAWYVTEGHHHRKGIEICQSKRVNPENHARICDLLDRMGLRYGVTGRDDKDINIGSSELAEYLLGQCGRTSRGKLLPEWLKNQPKDVLQRVLEVLIAGDGWVNGHSFCYKSISQRLLADVSEIAQKLGYGVTFNATGDVVNIRSEQNTPTLNMPPIREHYDGNIYCCTVPNSLIFVRVNGKAFWSHNSAYAISYTSQKLVESYSGGEKPNILLLGHYHKVEYLPGYRNVHSFQTGCVCGQSTFMRKKRLAADIGAWIIRANQAPDGSINRVQAEWIGPWYDREWTARKWCHSNDTPFAAYEHASLQG